MQKLSFEDIQAKKPSTEKVSELERTEIYALLDNVRSLHNVGAIYLGLQMGFC
jgi:tRNA G18 (ribose-2'-O)-methylase SpoU